jgi:hypothetical protein
MSATLAAATLRNVRMYLRSQGWEIIDHPNTRIEAFRTKPDDTGDYASLVLPRSPELSDATSLVNEAVRLIADYEKSPLDLIIDRVERWDRDVLRTRLFKVIGDEQTLPLEIAADAISSLKEFIGYAAYTHTNPQPFFDRVGPISAEFTKQCLFGHTFKGSFGLSVECPFSVTPTLALTLAPPPPPLERQVFERIANGFVTLSKSVQVDSIDPLLAGYRHGFNANMCRTLAELYEKADGRRIEFIVCWSPQLHSHYAGWKPVVFDGRTYDFARLAASELEKAETYPDTVVEGRITHLKSEMPPGLDDQAEFEHIITMFWEREKTQLVRIRVPLSPQQYMDACDAHKEGRTIRIFGIPEKSGKFWVLTKAHDFTVL